MYIYKRTEVERCVLRIYLDAFHSSVPALESCADTYDQRGRKWEHDEEKMIEKKNMSKSK